MRGFFRTLVAVTMMIAVRVRKHTSLSTSGDLLIAPETASVKMSMTMRL